MYTCAFCKKYSCNITLYFGMKVNLAQGLRSRREIIIVINFLGFNCDQIDWRRRSGGGCFCLHEKNNTCR